jgi:Na+/proline symporter
MSGLDIAVMTVYILAVIGVGVYFSRQRDATDYFLGQHALPWWAVMLSIVATETSALTVISVPGLGARGDLTFLQLPVGYLIGRIGVALWLLPGYFSGENETAYQRLENRFGPATRRVASGIFMGIRALGDSVRVFATAIPLHIVTGLSIPASIAAVAVATLLYTWTGGIKAVVWGEVLQLVIYVLGGLAALLVGVQLAGGLTPMLDRAADLDKLRIIDW